MTHHWTRREFALVAALTGRVRVLSLAQIRAGWFSPGTRLRQVGRDLERLIAAGLLQSTTWRVQPPPIAAVPLAVWRPGGSDPDFETLTPKVRNRWTAKRVDHDVYVATQSAARLMGSAAGRFPAENHRNHDLLLAAVYVRYLTRSPALARCWIGEDALPMAEVGVKNPDAFLADAGGRLSHAVESAGRYSREHLRLFHLHCSGAGLSYELW